MIEIAVYTNNQTGAGEPIATLSYSGKGDKVSIKTDNVSVSEELTSFLGTVLSFPKQGRVEPGDRKQWMESLPVANVSVPYWFRIESPTNETIEEEDDDNEEDAGEEESPDEGEAGGDDSGDTDDGGDSNSNERDSA